ncbi:hypothetical protein SAMN05421644_10241 [Allochromatium warmingii]|uniref:Uncharacterized protein n=1 Tax=Allochromatium warmingii TaxID=61595 RepID=A0A1H3B4R9_ALLWA|nr:hypothetical protein SAMN05421644_10241 [Allochromatium warmingii]
MPHPNALGQPEGVFAWAKFGFLKLLRCRFKREMQSALTTARMAKARSDCVRFLSLDRGACRLR